MYESIFFISFSLIAYSYFIYPLLLFIGCSLKKKTGDYPYQHVCPSLSVIIAAYNEESVIQEKIVNSLGLDYPSDKVEIFIGSDGSTDKTDELCKQYSTVKFVRIEPRQGKPNILNKLIPLADGEIIVLSDANTMIESAALKNLVRHFSDPAVGGICGKLILVQNNSNAPEACEGIYWTYESKIKEMESALYSTIASNGGIYAIRKNLYTEIPKDTIIDDLFISLNILEQHKRIVFEKNARAYEQASKNFYDEFWRKVRIGAGNFQTFFRKHTFLKNVSFFVSFAYLSHKIIRWFIPLLLIAIYVSCIKLNNTLFFNYIFWILNICILFTFVGIFFRTKNRIINFISYFFSLNFALMLGYLKYICGLQKITWRKATR